MLRWCGGDESRLLEADGVDNELLKDPAVKELKVEQPMSQLKEKVVKVISAALDCEPDPTTTPRPTPRPTPSKFDERRFMCFAS